MRFISKESISEINEIIRFCKNDKRFEWAMDRMINSMRNDRNLRKRVMKYDDYDESRTPGIIEEYNVNVIRFCEYAKKNIQDYKYSEVQRLIKCKMNNFTHKDGTLNEDAMKDLYKWQDENAIIKRIEDVKNYSQGRVKKYANKRKKELKK